MFAEADVFVAAAVAKATDALLMLIELTVLFWDETAETTNNGDTDDGDGVIAARMSMAAGGVCGEEVEFCTHE